MASVWVWVYCVFCVPLTAVKYICISYVWSSVRNLHHPQLLVPDGLVAWWPSPQGRVRLLDRERHRLLQRGARHPVLPVVEACGGFTLVMTHRAFECECTAPHCTTGTCIQCCVSTMPCGSVGVCVCVCVFVCVCILCVCVCTFCVHVCAVVQYLLVTFGANGL